MRIKRKIMKNGLLALLCILFVQMADYSLLLAEDNMTLTAAPTSVIADGASPSVITATVENAGTPQSGVILTFSTTLGSLSSNSVFSDPTGKGIVTLTSTSPGVASVTCVSQLGIVRVVLVTFTVVPTPSPTPQPTPPPELFRFVLSVDPPAVAADNLTPSEVSAQLYDQNGKALTLPGETVNFTTTPSNLAHFANNLTSISVSTNGAGRATALLYSPVVGTAAVNATVGSLTTNPVFVNFTGPGPTADIILTADPTSIAADSLSSSTLSAALFDVKGQPVPAGIEVDFVTRLGLFSNNRTSITAFTNDKGIAVAVIYAGSTPGTTQISASSNGVTRYVNITFTGSGPPAFISLSADSNWIPADGYHYTAITAVILDSGAQPVAPGTAVTFSTTLGVFDNGKTIYQVATLDDTGTVTVHLWAASASATGFAVITCTSGTVKQSLAINIVQLEFETGPNEDMAQADPICFDHVYLGQLENPYGEDWYTFTITTPSRIGINFITTAAPADADCDSGTTTVGTWKVDIRNSSNDILMSRHNIDCIFDNGIWETGVMPPGTYYIVVYCPRLGDGDIYLSDDYYMRVFDNFYFPCGDFDKQVNSASLTQENAVYRLHLPIVNPAPYAWADFQYDPIPGTGLMFRLTNYGVLTNLDNFRSCNLSSLSMVDGNYVMHVPVMVFDGVSYRIDLTYVPTSDGQYWFTVSGAWLN